MRDTIGSGRSARSWSITRCTAKKRRITGRQTHGRTIQARHTSNNKSRGGRLPRPQARSTPHPKSFAFQHRFAPFACMDGWVEVCFFCVETPLCISILECQPRAPSQTISVNPQSVLQRGVESPLSDTRLSMRIGIGLRDNHDKHVADHEFADDALHHNFGD